MSSLGLVLAAQVAQVQPRRWKVDANSRQDAVLMLSSVNLPGGVQVRVIQFIYTPRPHALLA